MTLKGMGILQDKKAEAVHNMLQLLEITADEEQKEQLILYVSVLCEGLKGKRLTGEKTVEGIIYRQIYDSLYLLKIKQFCPGSKVVDVGSGGGIPGIPIKIMLPDLNICMIEANRKKSAFIRQVSAELGLQNTEVCRERVEETGHKKDHRGQYDAAVCKALSAIDVLAEVCLPLVKIEGEVIFYKGPAGEKEILEAKKALKECGGQLIGKNNYVLPGGEARTIYRIKKIKATPDIYPRAVGKPFKNPIR